MRPVSLSYLCDRDNIFKGFPRKDGLMIRKFYAVSKCNSDCVGCESQKFDGF